MQNQFLELPFESDSESYTGQGQDIRFEGDEEQDPPLLQGLFLNIILSLLYFLVYLIELGIEPKEFIYRLYSVLNPFGKVNPDHWMDGDMAGYVLFVFALGFLLLLV